MALGAELILSQGSFLILHKLSRIGGSISGVILILHILGAEMVLSQGSF